MTNKNEEILTGDKDHDERNEPSETTDEHNVEQITTDNLQEAITELKDGKVPGYYKITAEMK